MITDNFGVRDSC